jgi:hypothetical protein
LKGILRTKLFLILLIVTLLTECVTKYQAWSKSQGYKETKIEDGKVKVSFAANIYTDDETVKDYLLYRCAELTLENKFDYFIILEQKNDKLRTNLTSSVVGYASVQLNSPPAYSYIIECGKGKKPDDYNAYYANDVKNTLESKIIR